MRPAGEQRPARVAPPEPSRPAAVLPPLKWAGGKRWLAPHLETLWRPHAGRRLVEPFCGGLAVALSLRPRRALLNDINPCLIDFYHSIQNGLTIDLPMENSRSVYDAHRRRFNDLLEAGQGAGPEAAALFYYLNRTGYNGLCRFNDSGLFNVPFGRYARIAYLRDFTPYASALSGWRFTCLDVEAVPLERSDFVYADPPYDVPFTSYSRGGFSWDDQVRTAERLSKHPGPVVLSNQATPRIRSLYRKLGFRLMYLDAPRRISCTGDRSPAREVLALKGMP